MKHFGKRNHFYIAVTLRVLYGDHPGWSAFITELHLIHSICLAEGRLKSEPNSIGSLQEAGSHWTQNRRTAWPLQRICNVLVHSGVILGEYCNFLTIL